MERTSDDDIPFNLDPDLAKAPDSVLTPSRKLARTRVSSDRLGRGGGGAARSATGGHQHQRQQQQRPTPQRIAEKKQSLFTGRSGTRKAANNIPGASLGDRHAVSAAGIASGGAVALRTRGGIQRTRENSRKNLEQAAEEKQVKRRQGTQPDPARRISAGKPMRGASDDVESPPERRKFLNLLLDELRDELRNELRDEMLRLPPSSGKVSERLLNFSEKLTEVTLADNVLSLPKDAPFLGERLLGSKLFIRTCYVDLEKIIFQLVKDGTRHVVVSGTPGTGKSVSGLYLLYLLRKERNTVIAQSGDNWFRFSDEDGVQKWGPREAIGISYLDDENAWLLCDPKEKEGPFQSFGGVTVVTISPDAGRIHDYNKQVGPIHLFMAMWTPDELEQCRKLIYPDVPEDDVKAVFKSVGGVAREAFNKLKLASKMKSIEDRAINFRVEDLQSAVYACNSTILLKVVGNTLFSILPREGYRSYDVTWASPDAMEMAMKTLEKKVSNTADA